MAVVLAGVCGDLPGQMMSSDLSAPGDVGRADSDQHCCTAPHGDGQRPSEQLLPRPARCGHAAAHRHAQRGSAELAVRGYRLGERRIDHHEVGEHNDRRGDLVSGERADPATEHGPERGVDRAADDESGDSTGTEVERRPTHRQPP